ncbi:inner nuclear membrane protein Man1 [Periplaneta americana]|uniref:inner nuclear membrane protein Man1 n=1 Tax=Periplaneta americana TaxID=6978 RepID=UPI0037E77D65
MKMASVDSLSDSELRSKLAQYGFPVGPVTETSRKVLVRKLKLLMGQSGRYSDVSVTGKWRRSSSQFSSGEEDSENDDVKLRINSSMPPPSSNYRSLKRKTSGIIRERSVTPGRMGRSKEIAFRSDLFVVPTTSTPESEQNKKRHSRVSVSQSSSSPIANVSSVRTPVRPPVSSTFKDGFDTGSDSDVDSKTWKNYAGQVSSNTSGSTPYSSFLSRLSSIRSKESDVSGTDSSSVNTLLGFRKSFSSSSSAVKSPESWTTTRPPNPPFQSNFVKRLSASGLSSASSTGATRGSAPSSIYDVKENDNVSHSPNGHFSPSRWAGLSSQSDLSKQFKTTEDEVKFGCNSQFVSMILLIVAALFFTVLAIIYVNVISKDPINFAMEDKANKFPVCEDGPIWYKTKDVCIDPEELMPAVKLVKIIHPLLIRRAIDKICYGEFTALMKHREMIMWLVKEGTYSGVALERHLMSLKILLLANPHWGISVRQVEPPEVTDITKLHLVATGSLVVEEPDLPLSCQLKLKFQGLFYHVMVLCFVICLAFGMNLVVQWYMRRRERDKEEIYDLVERIIEIMMRHQQNSCPTKQPYIVQNYVRDQIIPPAQRKEKARYWNRAVEWLKKNDSRVRHEMQNISGESVAVWRWLPSSASRNPSGLSEQTSPRRNNKVWQGQAFDTMTGSPNSLPCSPTPCLKIRHMFDLDMEYGEEWPVRVQDAILEKCGEEGVVALHISADRASREGCVYLKCASQEDAGKAYQALHGWWFDSNLVTVKYLRLERYHERFPEAQDARVPLHPSNNEKLSLQWQNPAENN